MPPPGDDAIRSRVLAHMNKDHQPELILYLRAWAGLSPSQAARDPQLEALTLDSMGIRTSDGTLHEVPIAPPMGSFSDARHAMVRLDRVARERLGLGDVTVREFRAARGVDAVVGGAVVFYYFTFFSLPRVLGGEAGTAWGMVRQFWDAVFPGGIDGYAWVVRTIFWMVVGIHATECFLLDRTRLARFGIPRGTGVWWLWMATCFFEGYPSFKRFDRVVAEVRDKEGKSK
jgi:hypothetical protein